jgi:hypothetical protein
MADDHTASQHTPTGHEIPIPTREEVLRDLAKVAKPKMPSAPVDRESGAESK